jgi:hypothetical protein
MSRGDHQWPKEFAMNQTLRVVLLAVSLLGPELCDATPGPEIEQWIAFSIMGNVNHPYPGLYFSTQQFETTTGVTLTVMSAPRYEILQSFTQAQIAPGACPGPGPVPREGVYGLVGLILYAQHRIQMCVLPQALGCKFLAAVKVLRGISWTKQELTPFREFITEVGCRDALAVSSEVSR